MRLGIRIQAPCSSTPHAQPLGHPTRSSDSPTRPSSPRVARRGVQARPSRRGRRGCWDRGLHRAGCGGCLHWKRGVPYGRQTRRLVPAIEQRRLCGWVCATCVRGTNHCPSAKKKHTMLKKILKKKQGTVNGTSIKVKAWCGSSIDPSTRHHVPCHSPYTYQHACHPPGCSRLLQETCLDCRRWVVAVVSRGWHHCVGVGKT